jgi:hypothetical protein
MRPFLFRRIPISRDKIKELLITFKKISPIPSFPKRGHKDYPPLKKGEEGGFPNFFYQIPNSTILIFDF